MIASPSLVLKDVFDNVYIKSDKTSRIHVQEAEVVGLGTVHLIFGYSEGGGLGFLVRAKIFFSDEIGARLFFSPARRAGLFFS